MGKGIERPLRAFRLVGLALAVLAAGALAPASSAGACPNEAFRTGPSAALPDCRAYELVTPASTNGRAIVTPRASFPYNFFPTEVVSSLSDSVIYMTPGTPLQQPEGANGTLDLYQAIRTAAGWQTTRRLSPSGAEAVFPNAGGVSSDHLYTFTQASPVQGVFDGGSLAEAGSASYLVNPDGSFELIGIGQLGTERQAQGRFISPGGGHIIFSTGDSEWCQTGGSCPVNQLEPNAAPTGTAAIYDRPADGATRVVSLLPGNAPLLAGQDAIYQGTSADGSTVAFKVGTTLYVRVDNATTVPVTGASATFAGLSADGDRIFYVAGGNIFGFAIGSEDTKQVNTSGDGEVVNISSDGSHVYFISKDQLDGANGTTGQPNLYVWTWPDETIDYIGTVAASDLEGLPALNNWTSWAVTPDKNEGQGPGANSSRTTPSGEVLVFESAAQLTGTATGGHTQIYRYDGVGQSIDCVSCRPDGAPSTADARLQALKTMITNLGGASIVVHNVTDDGKRVFFETTEDLVEADANGINDIYEWQEDGVTPDPQLDLISSGKGREYPNFYELEFQKANILFGVSPDGEDVVFLALDQLVPAAGGNGTSALYDARINGGFPEPPPPPQPCSGEACQALPAAPPALPSAKSPQVAGAGNVKPRRKCRRHKATAKRDKRRRCARKQAKRGRAAALVIAGSHR